MARPVLLDLYCGAGGAATGYAEAGFDVVGVDVVPQPNFPFRFVQMDALAFLEQHRAGLAAFTAVHASPPCQSYSQVTPLKYRSRYERSIPEVRNALVATGLPYIIENVEGAIPDMPGATRICGSSFGMDLRRHRLFETNWPLVSPPCNHEWQTPRFPSKDSGAPQMATVVGVHGEPTHSGDEQRRRDAMGIDWMTSAELVEAIPPTYTWFIGVQLQGFLRAGAALSELPVERLAKPCHKCGEVKKLQHFSKDRRNSDGRGGICKRCKFGVDTYG